MMHSSNKRIAINTIYMYIRLFVTMLIGLYTSRIVLQVLGVSDYGLFSVVGGILAMFIFISGSLATATSRFLNAEMGTRGGDLRKVFNVNIALHILLAILIFILAETIGLWYVLHKLAVEDGKLTDAIFVYQVAIVTACLGIVNTPYQSLFSAYEKFKFLMQVDILNNLLRLACVVALQFYQGEYALRLYGCIMCLTTVNTFAIYHWLASRYWPEVIRFKLVYGWRHYRDILHFGNWNLLATASFMARSSGSDLLINSFFGTTMNGAFAISRTVNQFVSQFSSNFDAASAPQIIQSYAAAEKERYTYLVNKMGRFCLLLFEAVFFPLYIELEYLLQLWLGEVPEGALIFTQLNLIVAGVSMTCGGLSQLINAYGRVKWFKIEFSIFFMACLPIGYLLFMWGYPAYTILVCFVVADLVQRIVQLILLRILVRFDSALYVKEAYVRPFIIAVIMSFAMFGYSFLNIENDGYRIIAILMCALITMLLIIIIGLSSSERSRLFNSIKAYCHQHQYDFI